MGQGARRSTGVVGVGGCVPLGDELGIQWEAGVVLRMTGTARGALGVGVVPTSSVVEVVEVVAPVVIVVVVAEVVEVVTDVMLLLL